mgnify:CR=1 FL=1
MLLMKDIIDDSNELIRTVSKEVELPLSKENHDLLMKMHEFLVASQDEELSEKYDLRPGMGLAAPQVGINERFFVVCYEEKENVFKNYILINPKLISHSEEMIYTSGGEGCLSVNRDVEGIVPRYARTTFEAYDVNGKKFKIRAREELSIAFQHELDHLNGILFYDHIDPKNPYKNADIMREI